MLHLALIALLAAHGADTATTMAALGARPAHVREWNPIMATIAAHPAAFGAAKLATAGALDWYLLRQQKKHPRAVLVAAFVGAAAVSSVAVHNARVVRK